jgi:hypothetical protein
MAKVKHFDRSEGRGFNGGVFLMEAAMAPLIDELTA